MKVTRLITVLLVLMSMAFAALGQDMTAEKAKLAKLETAYTTAKTKFQKKSTDSKLKSAYVTATVDYASAVMYSPALVSKEKYPKSLRLYREALKIDPKNAKALESKNTIEDIYRSMGRPIPK